MDINRLLQNLTREEKIALVSGSDQWHTAPIPRLGIPAIMMSDGPHGLRKQEMTGDNMGLGLSLIHIWTANGKPITSKEQ